MTDGKSGAHKDRRSKKAIGAGCAGLLLVAGALGVTALYLLTAIPPPDVDPHPLPNPNGYDAVKAAVQRLSPTQAGSPILEKAASAAELRKALSTDSPVLDQLHEALRLPYMIPPINVPSADYVGSARSFHADLRNGARKLGAKSRLAKAEARYGDAMDAALDGIALGVKAPRGGMIIDALVGVACVSLAGPEALSLVEHLSVPELRSARRRLEELIPQAVSEKDVLTQERRVMLQDARRSRFNPQERFLYHQMGQVYKEALREADKPSAERLPPASGEAMFGSLIAGVLPDLRESLDKRDRLLATLYVKLAVEEYRKTHHRLPQSLSDLTPEILSEPPLDPPTRKPLKYRRVGASYEIAPP